MGHGGILGSFEQQVMLAVAHGEGDAYGMTVRRAIVERTGREVTIGAVYATLDRLEAKAFITSTLRNGPSERRGRAKRLFGLLPAGAEALVVARQAHEQMWAGLDPAALARDRSQ